MKLDMCNARGLENGGHINGPVKWFTILCLKVDDSTELLPRVRRSAVTTRYGWEQWARDGVIIIVQAGEVKGVFLRRARCGWIRGSNVVQHIYLWCMEGAKGDIAGWFDNSWCAGRGFCQKAERS